MLTRRAGLFAGVCLALAGCDPEPGQRRAFINFLQTRVLDTPGVHVPKPTDEERKSWGDYARQYDLILDFNERLSERISKPMTQVIQRGSMRSVQELVDRRGEIRALQKGLQALAAEVDVQLQAAEAARAALKQPEDLKTVYDRAFDRDVTGPAQAFKEVVPVVQQSFGAALDLADYLVLNHSRLRIDGSNIQVPDPKLDREVQARLAASNAMAQQVQDSRRRLESLLFGS